MSEALGEAFFEELLWVHGMIRQDLETVRALAARAADGLPADEVAAELSIGPALRRTDTNPLWP